jgi:hypothetical protein
MTTPKKTTLKVINTKLNRLRAQKTALEFKEKSQTKQQRMKRTRALIQTGGLLKVAGILERFSITLGDDLQSDQNNHDKAATLLGVFVSLIEQLPHEFTEDELKALKNKGIRAMQVHEAKLNYD